MAIPVGSGLYSASFGRSTEPRKRVSAHAGNDPYRAAPLHASGGKRTVIVFRSFRLWALLRRFYPRPAKGTTIGNERDPEPLLVSIHAPAKGTTDTRGARRDRARFYPRPREGGDQGRRPHFRFRECFYPRPREGGDGLYRDNPLVPGAVSIHAPAKGATIWSALKTA